MTAEVNPMCKVLRRQLQSNDAQVIALQVGCDAGARYLEVRLLLENNELSNEGNIAWARFIRN
jgi:hypothetical protein